MTNSILGIEGEAGIGTGFRVANNLVTASHVVGSGDTVRVTWGSSAFMARVVKHLGNDIAILNLPSEANDVQPFKFPKTVSDGTIVVTGMNANGDYIVATAEGIMVKDHWTYAIQTLDGMSGAPITNAAGRVVGVHLSNTGFTGGGAVLRQEDVHHESEVERLRREVGELKAQLEKPVESPASSCVTPSKPKSILKKSESNHEGRLNQSYNMLTSEIVALVREAVRVEMEVLRHELDHQFDQAKGKTKNKARVARGGKSRKPRRVRAWTEEEYKAMQEKGYTRAQLQDMANIIIERMNEDLLIDEGDEGYPEWEDPPEEELRETEREWLGTNIDHDDYVNDSYRKGDDWNQCCLTPDEIHVDSDFNPKTHPWDVLDKYSMAGYYITAKDVEIAGPAIEKFEDYLTKWILRNLNDKHEWRAGVDTVKELEELAKKKLELENYLVSVGLTPFCQRKKRERRAKTIKRPKN